MSVVRIPLPEEDAFPWPRVVAAIVVGGAVGLGFAYWGMERDRAAESATGDAESLAEVAPPPGAPAEPRPEIDEPTLEPAPELAGPAPEIAEPGAEPAVIAEPAPEIEEPTPEPATEIAEPAPEIEAPPTVTSTPVAAPPAGPVHLVPGRVAYLRCVGVPQQPGPFPCPRDEALESAVWSALAEVDRCATPPGVGQADIVIDLAGPDAAPTIRARDTFAPDVPRADATALLACSADSLANVRSSLRPTRLVVSFRLSVAPASR